MEYLPNQPREPRIDPNPTDRSNPAAANAAERVAFEHATAFLHRFAKAIAHPLKQPSASHLTAPTILAITGPVGAGKTTLARQLSPCILSTDNYLPDYDSIPYADRDNPAHVDLTRLLHDLDRLRSGHAVEAPIWSFQTHSRIGTRTILPPSEDHAAALIVVEGIHALYPFISGAFPIAHPAHIPVFVEAPSSVRWQRWKHLEETGQRGWGVEQARAFFDAVAEPTFARYEPHYRSIARVIVTNDKGVPTA